MFSPDDAKFRGALLRLSSDFSVANATWTSLSFDVEIYDTENMSNFGTITIPAGVPRVRITGGVVWSGNLTGVRFMNLDLNQSAVARSSLASHAQGTVGMNASSAVIPVEEGDVIQVTAWQNSGGSLSVQSSPSTFVAVEIVE